MAEERVIKIGMLGLGTVGTGNIGFLHRTAFVRFGNCILYDLGKFLHLDFHEIILHYVFN